MILREDRVMDIYSQSTLEEKKRLLKTMISRAEYIKTGRDTRGNADRCNFTLNVIPLTAEEFAENAKDSDRHVKTVKYQLRSPDEYCTPTVWKSAEPPEVYSG